MALTRKMLKAMGIEDEKIEQIIEEHSETVEALKQQRDEFKAAAEENQQAAMELVKARKQLDELMNDQTPTVPQSEYEVLKAKYEDLTAKRETDRRESIYRGLLRDAGISDKRIDTVLRVTDLQSMEFDDDGNLTNRDPLIADITKEWADFIPNTETRYATPDTPPSVSKGKMTRDEILAIQDKGERQKAIAENHEQFGF